MLPQLLPPSSYSLARYCLDFENHFVVVNPSSQLPFSVFTRLRIDLRESRGHLSQGDRAEINVQNGP